jgi:hypothetical protein
MGDGAWIRVFRGLLLLVYLSVFPYLPALNNPNENTRIYLTMALVDHGTFRLDPVVKRFGWTNDMARVPDGEGAWHYAAVKGPFMAYLGVPIYAVQRGVLALAGQRLPGPEATADEAAAWLRKTALVLQFFGVHLPCGLFLLLLEQRLRWWSRDPTLRLSAVAAVGLGTNFLAYSFSFVSHAWSAVAAFLALDTIARERLRARGDPRCASARTALGAGLLASLPTLLEYQGLCLSLVLGIYGISLFRRPRTLAAFGAGVSLGVLGLLLFQWRSFGSPWRTGVLFMETAAFRAAWHEGFLGFSWPRSEALQGLLLDGGYGLFGASPWLWLGLAGAAAPGLAWGSGRVRRERQLQLSLALLMCGLLTLLIASGNMWRGGWTIGPRYLGAAPALLALPGVALAEGLARRGGREAMRALCGGLALASFARMGLVSLLVVTLPESIERPLVQVALPLLREGLFPLHGAELLGLRGGWGWYGTAGAAVGALGLMVVASEGSWRRRGARGVGALLVGAVMTAPGLRLPPGKRDAGPEVRAMLRSVWAPVRPPR